MSKAEEKATRSTWIKRAGLLSVEKGLINSGRVDERWPKHQRTPSYINGDASQCMYQHMFSNNVSLTSERPHLLIPHDDDTCKEKSWPNVFSLLFAPSAGDLCEC